MDEGRELPRRHLIRLDLIARVGEQRNDRESSEHFNDGRGNRLLAHVA